MGHPSDDPGASTIVLRELESQVTSGYQYHPLVSKSLFWHEGVGCHWITHRSSTLWKETVTYCRVFYTNILEQQQSY